MSARSVHLIQPDLIALGILLDFRQLLLYYMIMVESFPNSFGQANFDYFYGRPENSERRQEYLDRGLIPTNNLCLYFFESSQKDLAPGIPNHYNYHNRPFGQILQTFRDNNPELWEEARQAAEVSSAAMKEFSDHLFARESELAEEKRPRVVELSWVEAEVFNRVFDIIAPELAAAGINPLDVCV